MPAIDYLRISLVDRCNFQCQYCMPEGVDLQYLPQQEWLTRAELSQLLQEVFMPLGFSNFRLTGGEPLVRPGVVDIVRDIAQLPGTRDLALTTNAFLLSGLAQDLWDAGLRRINISLDSLDPAIFDQIVGGIFPAQAQRGGHSRRQRPRGAGSGGPHPRSPVACALY